MGKEIITKQGRGRPKKNSKEVEENRLSLIFAGIALLTQKGFGATGLDEITKNAGLPKGSFYAYFDSKEIFGLALIDAYANFFDKMLDRLYLNEARSPLERINDFISEASFNVARHDFKRGCLVGNLGQEICALPDVFRQRLIDVLYKWQKKTETCLLAAQTRGEIPPEVNCSAKAQLFWIGWEGAVLRAKLERRANPLDAFRLDFEAGLKK
jgi:TetR/AcrR family transcriptional repressor of nem operon